MFRWHIEEYVVQNGVSRLHLEGSDASFLTRSSVDLCACWQAWLAPGLSPGAQALLHG